MLAFLKAFGFAKEKVNVLVVGLDNSGKTTLINHLKCKKTKVNEVVPTVGFSVEEFSRHNLSFCVFDMSGQGRYRSLWESYYRDAHAIIYVLDCTDKLRMTVARDELNGLLEHADIKNKCIPVLFFANKMDLPNALSPVDCMGHMSLEDISSKPWHITSSNALSGEGVEDGIAWLGDQLLAH